MMNGSELRGERNGGRHRNRKTKKNPETKKNVFRGGGCSLWFRDGDRSRSRSRCHPFQIKESEDAAALAVHLYNKTHLNKYSVVEVLSAAEVGLILNIIFTAKPEPASASASAFDDNKYPIYFRASVNNLYTCVEYVEIVRDAHLHALDYNLPKKKEPVDMFRDGPVLYGPDCTTCCDDETKNILNESTDLALQVRNNTHIKKYILPVLVSATGHISTGSISKVDLMFTAKPDPLLEDSDAKPRTFRARVFFLHKYVEFVGLLPPPTNLTC
ncbi:hypothetical protein ABFS83_06G049900 [Erythranthe nasuta]